MESSSNILLRELNRNTKRRNIKITKTYENNKSNNKVLPFVPDCANMTIPSFKISNKSGFSKYMNSI